MPERLNVSNKEYEHFKSPSLHWFCPSYKEKVIKNLRSDNEVDVRCAQFFKAMEQRVVMLESEIKNKVDKAKVK